jgi:predicted acylesterase/phospholipase RssA
MAKTDKAASEPARPEPALPTVTAVYGGGGPFGIIYGLGVADALLDLGIPLRSAMSLGTSAGAWVASCLATKTTYELLCEMPAIRVPNPNPGFLRGIARTLFGTARSELVRVCAVRVPSGRPVILSGALHDLADLVAASSAVPWLFPPARIGRRFYADGGVRSLVHADKAAEAQHLVVVAPIAGPMFGPGGRAMEIMLRRELRRWRQRTGGTAHLIRPDAGIATLARHPLDLFDKDRALAAYPMAYEQASQLAADWAALPLLAADGTGGTGSAGGTDTAATPLRPPTDRESAAQLAG